MEKELLSFQSCLVNTAYKELPAFRCNGGSLRLSAVDKFLLILPNKLDVFLNSPHELSRFFRS